MVERKTVQIIVAIVAAVWLALALLDGKPLSPTPLKLYSTGVTVVTFAFVAYDRYLWRWLPIRHLTGLPRLEGTWRGTVVSSYLRDGQPIPAIPTVLRVKQTAGSVSMTLFTAESTSVSEQAKLLKEADGRWRLSWLYANTPHQRFRDRSERHQGACYVYVASGTDGLNGEYFTDRLTRGELKMNEWSKRKYDKIESALTAPDFVTPRPFARTK